MQKIISLPKSFSIYMDGLRLFAAYYVFLFHLKKLQIGDANILEKIPDHGHDAVILFFVLSGYVIASAVDRKKASGWRDYFLDRAARVYSVAVPTLVFCLLAAFGIQLLSSEGTGVHLTQLLVSSLINFFFLGQSWSLKEWVPYNQPYWSLCYEVMYYALFGVAIFAKGVWRWIGLLLVAIIAGPKVMLLLPCWLLGVAAYHWRDKFILTPHIALLVGFVLPPLVLFFLNKIGYGPMVRGYLDGHIENRKELLEFSKDFLIDWTTAVLVAVNLYAVRYIHFNFPGWLSSIFVKGAAASFTLYLMHMPMALLFVNILGDLRKSYLWFFAVAIGIPIVCYVISQYTENRRAALRALLATLLTPSK